MDGGFDGVAETGSSAHGHPGSADAGPVDVNYDLPGVEGGEEARVLSDEEPTLTVDQQKDLFTKVLNNRSRQVEELFALGVPVDTTDEHGNTSLHVACQCGSKRMVKACLRWGADINRQNVCDI